MNGLQMVWYSSEESLVCRWVDAEEKNQWTSASTQSLEDSGADRGVNKAHEFTIVKVA
jgi:hypothetical protein